MRRSRLAALAVAAVVVAVTGAYGIHYFTGGQGSPLIVYSADAYVQETNHMLSGFHNSTGAPVVSARGGGSYTDARDIGQGDPANAFVSVALESYNQSYLGSRYSGWAVAFASDQLVLAYSTVKDSSAVSDIVGQFSSALSTNSTPGFASAYANLTSGKVKVGISDPSSDPAGLRGWISLEIAGSLYAGNQSYYTGKLAASGGLVNNSNAAALVAPLITGEIQFLFIYKSAAISKNLSYIDLPSMANFGDPSLASFYSGFSYDTANGLAHGSVIFLYVSALAGNGNMAQESVDFAAYVVNHSGEMTTFGLEPLVKPILYNNSAPPQAISDLLGSGRIVSGGAF